VAKAVVHALLICLAILAPAIGAEPSGKPHARIGFLGETAGPTLSGLRQGLLDLGYHEKDDIRFVIRVAQGNFARYPKLADDLVRQHVDLIVASGMPAVMAMRHATTTIPIVMAIVGDPVGAGLLADTAHPGGNITGLGNIGAELEPKRLELLRELVPGLARIAVLRDKRNPGTDLDSLKPAAAAAGISLDVVDIREGAKVDLGAMLAKQPQAVLALGNLDLFGKYDLAVDFLTKNRLPAVIGGRAFVARGGLLSYTTNLFDVGRQAANYADRILKGARPGDLPVQQPNGFDLVVNLKTAHAMGVAIPPAVLRRATEAIE
jgi:putative ABC transport system substrate-binding protein